MLKAWLFRKMNLPVPTWGVWVDDIGWFGRNGARAYMVHDKSQARSVAHWVGKNARVEYIDNCLIDMEQKLLSIERERRKG
jgi:hypothetical protein